MTIVVASMVVIMLTAVLILLAVFGMHLITRSVRLRTKLRRWWLAAGTTAYSVRREVGHRARLVGRYARQRLGPPASRAWRGLEPVAERTGGLAERVTPVAERARPLLLRVRTGFEYVRPLAPPRAHRSGESEPVHVTSLFPEPPAGEPEERGDGADPPAAQAAR